MTVYKSASTENIRYYSKVIALLSFVLVFVITMGATAAWLTAQAIDKATMVFARNVEIHITGANENVGAPILPQGIDSVLPGQPIKVTSGILLQSTEVNTKSPDAYIRVRFEVSTPVHNGDYGANALVFTEQPDENYWKLVDFSPLKDGSDMWYVLYDKSTGLAREVKDGQKFNFLNDTVVYINRNLTNEMGGRDISVHFVAQAYQVKNLPNPLADINNPQWIFYVPVG